MSGEPQLERSVLEGKERDKLQAIAEALGLKPTARAKKADLIDGILRATGVEVAPPADAEAARPRRVTRKRVASAEQNGPVTPGPADQGGDPAPAEVTPAASDDAAPVPPAGSGGGQAATGGAVAVGAGEGTSGEVPSGVGGGPAAPARPTSGAEAPSSGAGGAEGSGHPADETRNGGTTPQPRPQPQPQAQAQQPRPGPPGPPGPGNQAVQPGNQHQQAQGNQQPAQPQPGQGQPVEGDVRRNRRRRGRDRDRASYDQQAQQADQAYAGEPLPCDGLLEVRPEGFGFLRTAGYLPGPDDVYVSTSQVRRFALRAGDRIVGASRPATTQERYGALLRVDSVGGQSPDEARRRRRFDDLTAVFPDERLTLELGDPSDPANTTCRIIDLLSPIGKGQRVLIVSPPKAGKTTVLSHIARAIEANHPDVDLMVVLVDERPEEVTELRRTVQAEVIGSTFDRPAEEHTHVAELAIEVAKRRAELGRDVVVVIDGLTRLARAYNLAAPADGRVLPGGLDPGAVPPVKRLFGAGRKAEEGGSLTVLATVLTGTGSTVDSLIFEELRDTATTELRLDRRLADLRVPAIDALGSSTRHDELLLTEEELRHAQDLRRALLATAGDGSGAAAAQTLLDTLARTRTNAEALADLARTPA